MNTCRDTNHNMKNNVFLTQCIDKSTSESNELNGSPPLSIHSYVLPLLQKTAEISHKNISYFYNNFNCCCPSLMYSAKPESRKRRDIVKEFIMVAARKAIFSLCLSSMVSLLPGILGDGIGDKAPEENYSPRSRPIFICLANPENEYILEFKLFPNDEMMIEVEDVLMYENRQYMQKNSIELEEEPN